jgi:hypothetical protein
MLGSLTDASQAEKCFSMYWATLIASLLPGALLFVIGQALFIRGRDPESMRLGLRLAGLGGSLVRVLPALAIIVLVVSGQMQGPALIAALLLLGSELFRRWAFRTAS